MEAALLIKECYVASYEELVDGYDPVVFARVPMNDRKKPEVFDDMDDTDHPIRATTPDVFTPKEAKSTVIGDIDAVLLEDSDEEDSPPPPDKRVRLGW